MPKNSEDFNDESLLRSLREYKRRDPDYRRAIDDFVEGEVKYGKDDPCEGKVVDTKSKSPKRSI
jgi:hypothetical protein